MEITYTVKQLALLSGVSVRTLHLYDETGLLKPHVRTDARYRLYSDKELLRLQQILFYRELDFPLKEIRLILDEPEFDLVHALENHRKALNVREKRLNILLKTIDNTIQTLQNKKMINSDELYDGLSKEQANAYRREAINAYGPEIVEKAEIHLRKLDKSAMQLLVSRQKELALALSALKHEDPAAEKVQELIHLHYLNTRKLWGTEHAEDPQAEAYQGLGKLYLTDQRFTQIEGRYDTEFAAFLNLAMSHYAAARLSQL